MGPRFRGDDSQFVERSMAPAENISRGALGGAIALSLAIVLLWVVALGALPHQSGSDAAGNGLAQAFAAIELFVLWALLAS